jgi:ferredoxin-NADP reductase
MRSYTPINEIGILEELRILIKLYDDGAMSQVLSKLEVGQQVKFKVGKNRYQLSR